MENAKHTAGPWKFGGMNTRHIYSPDGHAICTMHAYQVLFPARDIEQVKSDAAYIVRACNSHEALLKALLLVNENNDGVLTLDAIQAVRAAIAQAEDK